MQIVLKFTIRTELHPPHNADHGRGVGFQPLCQRAYAEQNESARMLESKTDNFLSSRAQQAESSRQAYWSGRTRFCLSTKWHFAHDSMLETGAFVNILTNNVGGFLAKADNPCPLSLPSGHEGSGEIRVSICFTERMRIMLRR